MLWADDLEEGFETMITVNGMRGLGDNIYQRAFVKQLVGEVAIDTPWPEIYAGIPGLRFIRPVTKLRTQQKNIARQPGWHVKPPYGTQLFIKYGTEGIFKGMQEAFRVAPGVMDLPPLPASVAPPGPYVVVRPVTLRTEWLAASRNPDPVYVAEASAEAARRGYTVISVADLEPGKEFIRGAPPPAHLEYHQGQLDVMQLLALVAGASAVIGGIGWIVPACIAAKVPAWVVCGGQGGFNAPELIAPPGSTVSFAVPDNFCRCKTRDHNCDKRISNHAEKFTRWADQHLAVV